MVKNVYIIAGYNLTGLRDRIITEKWMDDPYNEQYYCKQQKGEIQLFHDPISSKHLYFGYIINVNDEYEENTLSLAEIQRQKMYVDYKLNHMGFELPRETLPYQIISFVEYR